MNILFITIFIMPIIVAIIAHSKNRNWVVWLLYALLLWPIALVHSLLLKELKASKDSNWKENSEGPRRCPSPACNKIVHGDYENCPYCKAPMSGAVERPCPKCGEYTLTHLPLCIHCKYDLKNNPENIFYDERECPECAEMIKMKAKKCKHCGSVVTPIEAPKDRIITSQP